MPLWEKVKGNLIEWYGVAADKTEEMAKIGVRRYDRFGISRDIERQFTELGSLVYNGVSEGQQGILEQESLLTILSRIQELELELQLKEEEIGKIRVEARERKAAAAQAGGEPELLIKDPALGQGSAESAILMGEGEQTTGVGTAGEAQADAGPESEDPKDS
jgi:hypothetical protein